MENKIHLIVKPYDHNIRVDLFINKYNKNISRSRIKKLILNNNLKINNKLISNPSKKISINDKISLLIPEPKKK